MHFFVVASLINEASALMIDIRRNIIFISSFLDNGIIDGEEQRW